MRFREVVASVLVGAMVACSGTPRARWGPVASYTQETRWYDVDVVERGITPVQPVPVDRGELPWSGRDRPSDGPPVRDTHGKRLELREARAANGRRLLQDDIFLIMPQIEP